MTLWEALEEFMSAPGLILVNGIKKTPNMQWFQEGHDFTWSLCPREKKKSKKNQPNKQTKAELIKKAEGAATENEKDFSSVLE